MIKLNTENFQYYVYHSKIYFTFFLFRFQDSVLSKGSSVHLEVITTSTFYYYTQIIYFMKSLRNH